MRMIVIAIAAVVTAVVLDSTGSPSYAGCQVVGCSTECWMVAPGHRRCRERCTRRCWNDAPRYYAPAPEPRYYAPTPSYHPDPPFDPGAVVAFGIAALVIGAIVAAIAGSTADTTTREIAAIEQQTQSMRDETAAYDAALHDIRAYKADLLEEAERQGRRDADEEWQRRITHG